MAVRSVAKLGSSSCAATLQEDQYAEEQRMRAVGKMDGLNSFAKVWLCGCATTCQSSCVKGICR
jgi:hypothetical protein